MLRTSGLPDSLDGPPGLFHPTSWKYKILGISLTAWLRNASHNAWETVVL
jgi:hypothetical protein